MNSVLCNASALISIRAKKPAFVDFRLGGTVLGCSIPNTRAFLAWLGVRITHHVRSDRGEHFRIHGFGEHHSPSDECIDQLIRIARQVEFFLQPEDLGVMLRYIALQDKAWGHGQYRPMSEIPSPKPED